MKDGDRPLKICRSDRNFSNHDNGRKKMTMISTTRTSRRKGIRRWQGSVCWWSNSSADSQNKRYDWRWLETKTLLVNCCCSTVDKSVYICKNTNKKASKKQHRKQTIRLKDLWRVLIKERKRTGKYLLSTVRTIHLNRPLLVGLHQYENDLIYVSSCHGSELRSGDLKKKSPDPGSTSWVKSILFFSQWNCNRPAFTWQQHLTHLPMMDSVFSLTTLNPGSSALQVQIPLPVIWQWNKFE